MKFAQLAEKVTAEMIAALEAGAAPWVQPWSSAGAARNYGSKRAYTGFNQFYLSYLGRHYSAPYYLTFKQAKELGGSVKKGETSIPVIYWLVKPKGTRTTTNEATGQKEEEYTKGVFIPYVYHVFNIDQVEGIDFEIPELSHSPNNALEMCEDIVSKMPLAPERRTAGSSAYYVPALDFVSMPPITLFKSSEAYYSTLFHEFVHATGHPSRLDRFSKDKAELPNDTRAQLYGKEELVAEMGAAILCGSAGIANESTQKESASYLQGWINTLKGDNTLLIYAAARASKAAAFILNESINAEDGDQTPSPEAATPINPAQGQMIPTTL